MLGSGGGSSGGSVESVESEELADSKEGLNRSTSTSARGVRTFRAVEHCGDDCTHVLVDTVRRPASSAAIGAAAGGATTTSRKARKGALGSGPAVDAELSGRRTLK